MATNHNITATGRKDEGKGASRRLRRSGHVPAIVYGGHKDPMSVQIEHNHLWIASQNEWFYSAIVDLAVDGKVQKVLLRDMQRHPFKQQILHLDFLRVSENEALRAKVPLHFVNQEKSPAGKSAGVVVTHELNEVEVSCLPKDLPEFIEVDLSALAVGDIMHLSQVKLPKESYSLLLGLVLLAPVLSYVPMAALASLLIIVAWNMSEAPKAVHLLKTAPRSDIWVFITCFSLTVLFDMVIAITTGILLATVLFVKEIAQMSKVTDISNQRKQVEQALPDGWQVLKISGPLFFAAADRIFADIARLSEQSHGLVLYMDGVPLLDAGGLAALNKLISKCQHNNTELVIADLQFQPLKTLAKAGVQPREISSVRLR